MIMQCHQLYISPETPSQSCSSSKGTGEHISVVQSIHLLPCGNFYHNGKDFRRMVGSRQLHDDSASEVGDTLLQD